MRMIAPIASVLMVAASCAHSWSTGADAHDSAPRRRLTAFRDRLAAAGVIKELAIDGYRYTFADAGRGPCIVLLHGIGGSLYDWRHLIEPLAADFRVIALDLLGAGESDKPPGADYSVVAQARRVKGLLDALGVETAILGGNSYGGGIAIAFAQNWPDRLTHLVLIDSVCYPEHIPAYVHLCQVPTSEHIAKVLPLRTMTRWVLRGSYRTVEKLSDEEIDAYVAELAPLERREALIKSVRALVAVDTREFEQRIHAIPVPTLVLWGTEDSAVPLALGRRLAQELPRAILVELEAGHVPNQETPAEVLEHLRRFLRG